MKTNFLILLILLNFNYSCFPQKTTNSSKAQKLYLESKNLFDANKNNEAIKNLQKAIEIDSKFIEAYLMLGVVYNSQKDYENEISSLQKVAELDPYFYKNTLLNLAKAQMNVAKYQDAKNNLTKFLQIKDINQETKSNALINIDICDFRIEQLAHPQKVQLINMGDSINSKFDDYWATISADDEIFIKTTRLKMENNYEQEDFFESRKNKNGNWTKAKNIGATINTYENEGAASITADGNFMFFTACSRKDGLGNCDIYFSEKVLGRWTAAKNLGTAINTNFSEKQPSISADGRTLYFASNRPNGKGKMDIWTSKLNEKNIWQTPTNIGNIINTREDEIAPFIHRDNTSLYFSSKGHIGMGNLDIFVSKKQQNIWQKPQNIGYPINTEQDEFGFVINTKGDIAYLSKNTKEKADLDIYYFNLPENIRPQETIYIKGRVTNEQNEIIPLAKIQLKDIESNNLEQETYSNQEGKYLVCLTKKSDFALHSSKAGYLFYSENFALKDSKEKDFYKIDIVLKKASKGNSIVLKNIFFDTDSYSLKNESYAELDKIVEFLKENPQIKIEIAGHTDDVGTAEYNLKLSSNRAKEVANYLITKGISNLQIANKGYGYSKPITKLTDEKSRALNRRTELVVI